MTYTWTDRHGDRLTASAETLVDGSTVVSLEIQDGIDVCIVHVPLDRLEELVAGLRDTGRQAAASAPPSRHIGQQANAEDCPACHGTNPPYPFLCPGGVA